MVAKNLQSVPEYSGLKSEIDPLPLPPFHKPLDVVIHGIEIGTWFVLPNPYSKRKK